MGVDRRPPVRVLEDTLEHSSATSALPIIFPLLRCRLYPGYRRYRRNFDALYAFQCGALRSRVRPPRAATVSHRVILPRAHDMRHDPSRPSHRRREPGAVTGRHGLGRIGTGLACCYKRVKGTSHSVWGRIRAHPQQSHANSQACLLSLLRGRGFVQC